MKKKFVIDDSILQKLREGDARIFKQLFEAYSPIFKGVCYRYTGSNERSNDIIQEAFVKIFKNVSGYTGSGNFEGWMKRIVVNCCLDYIKQEHRFSFDSERVLEAERHTTWDIPMSELGVKEIVRLIDQLPDGLRTVFNLSVFEGFSHKEIGNALGISESASRAQLAKAKTKLRAELKKLNIFSASA